MNKAFVSMNKKKLKFLNFSVAWFSQTSNILKDWNFQLSYIKTLNFITKWKLSNTWTQSIVVCGITFGQNEYLFKIIYITSNLILHYRCYLLCNLYRSTNMCKFWKCFHFRLREFNLKYSKILFIKLCLTVQPKLYCHNYSAYRFSKPKFILN